jgi:hypothetical protein
MLTWAIRDTGTVFAVHFLRAETGHDAGVVLVDSRCGNNQIKNRSNRR